MLINTVVDSSASVLDLSTVAAARGFLVFVIID